MSAERQFGKYTHLNRMPGGLLALVCYGNENILVNGNPDVTWFYKSFLRHTHFSQEPIQVQVEGPSLLLMDSPILLKAKIPRQGDLLSDLVLRVQLPDIFSKLYLRTDVSGNAISVDRAYEFQWVRRVGVRMIQKVTCTIGGQTIQEFNNDWIMARALLDNDNTQYQKWRSMVGDVPELFDPQQGVYADVSSGNPLYPNVVAWRGSPSNPNPLQNNAPSIPGRILRIPLGLWFSDVIHNSLPLIGLQYHDCEIQIQMSPIRDLYTILDPNGIRLRYGIQSLPYIPTDQYPGIYNPNEFGPLPPSLNNLYGTGTDLSGSLKYFLTDISGAIPLQDGWPLNATLEATYTFLRQEEQQVFTKKTIRYNVRQAQNFVFTGIQTRNTYRLDVHNIATRIVAYARRSDSLPFRNQATNLTNWIDPRGKFRPFVVPLTNPQTDTPQDPNKVYPNYIGSPTLPLQYIGRSGLNLPGLQRRILKNMFFTANGTPLFDSEDSNYFTEYVPFQYLRGAGTPFQDYGLASQSEMWPMYSYSFALHGSEIAQPTGTLNTSRIDRLEVDVDVEPIPVLAGYTYELQVFVETLNFLEISTGLGGLKFAK